MTYHVCLVANLSASDMKGLYQKLDGIDEFELLGCVGIFSSTGLVMFVNTGCDCRPEFQSFGAQLSAGISHLLVPAAAINRWSKHRVTMIIETGEGVVYALFQIDDKMSLLIRAREKDYPRIAQFVPTILQQLRKK